MAVTAAFWWLPVVWWVRRTLREAEEQCCDAWVVWTFPDKAQGVRRDASGRGRLSQRCPYPRAGGGQRVRTRSPSQTEADHDHAGNDAESPQFRGRTDDARGRGRAAALQPDVGTAARRGEGSQNSCTKSVEVVVVGQDALAQDGNEELAYEVVTVDEQGPSSADAAKSAQDAIRQLKKQLAEVQSKGADDPDAAKRAEAIEKTIRDLNLARSRADEARARTRVVVRERRQDDRKPVPDDTPEKKAEREKLQAEIAQLHAQVAKRHAELRELHNSIGETQKKLFETTSETGRARRPERATAAPSDAHFGRPEQPEIVIGRNGTGSGSRPGHVKPALRDDAPEPRPGEAARRGREEAGAQFSTRSSH